MTTKPPYPTVLIKELEHTGTSLKDRYSDFYYQLEAAVDYWLTPRKCSEQAPEFPCEVWSTTTKSWRTVDEYRFKQFEHLYRHWRPSSPPPEKS